MQAAWPITDQFAAFARPDERVREGWLVARSPVPELAPYSEREIDAIFAPLIAAALRRALAAYRRPR